MSVASSATTVQPPGALATLAKVVRLMRRANRARLARVILLTTLTGGLPAIIAWLTRDLIDGVVAGASTVGVIWAIALASAVSTSAFLVLSGDQSLLALEVQGAAERALVSSVSRMPIGVFDEPEFHDALARAGEGLAFRPTMVLDATLRLCSASIAVVSFAALLMSTRPLLVLIGVLAVVPLVRLKRSANVIAFGGFFEASKKQREREYVAAILSDRGGGFAKELRVHGLGRFLEERYDQLLAHMVAVQTEAHARVRTRGMASALVVAGALGISYSYAFIGSADISPGDVALIVAAIGGLTAYSEFIVESWGTLDESRLFLAELFRLTDVEPVTGGRLRCNGISSVTFENVSFGYATDHSLVLQNVSLSLTRGTLTVIVGENGAGKSTLLKLLLGLYAPLSGSVTIDGIDLCEYDLASFHAKCGVVCQDFGNFELTLRDIVTMVAPSGTSSDDTILECLNRSGCDGLVQSIGLDSPVGRQFSGRDLSGGQWQRLASARLFNRNADFWLLDEPAAALDPHAEHALLNRLRLAKVDRTIVVITQRIRAAAVADQVIVMDGGRIVETGTHRELLNRRGRYAELFIAQQGEVTSGHVGGSEGPGDLC